MTVPVHPRPSGPVVMRQRWMDLLFLHWQWSPEDIQSTLPPGLTVDTYQGTAWLGVVPFFMEGVRPVFCPSVPLLSNFLELNVRTYVRDSHGNPGVWFYSLDCNQAVAVQIARRFFHLPYFDAKMKATRRNGRVDYRSQRKNSTDIAGFCYEGGGAPASALQGSLEEFLVERYRLFSKAKGQLYAGEVWHTPYLFSKAATPAWSSLPLTLAGFSAGNRPPDHAIYSKGVDVRVYPLRKDQSGLRMSQ